MGSTWLTRSLPLAHPAAAPLGAGSRFGASLAVKDRRVAEARLELTGRPGRALGFLAMPTLGAIGWPDLRRPQQRHSPVLVRPEIGGRVGGSWHDATATLELRDHPHELIGELAGTAATEATVGWLGITVTGACDA
jgi:hypothetical protein